MRDREMQDQLVVGIAQVAPVWLDREATLAKVCQQVREAAEKGCELVAFGEALVPGYPFWIEHTDGARFNDPFQKRMHAHYLEQAVCIEEGHLKELCDTAAECGIAVALGMVERPLDRGGHSLYCAAAYIDPQGQIQSVHRKLMPTFEERLSWAAGDGRGLQVHALKNFNIGVLNCWENWLPLVRAAMYGQGENVRIALWPGGYHNTHDITRFIAKEARSYVISVSGLMKKEHCSPTIPGLDLLQSQMPEVCANGGSCCAGPDGEWVLEPVLTEEGVFVVSLDKKRILEERHNFDVSGHYARPDVTELIVNRKRLSTVVLKDE